MAKEVLSLLESRLSLKELMVSFGIFTSGRLMDQIRWDSRKVKTLRKGQGAQRYLTV